MTGSTTESPLGSRVRARRQRRGWTLKDLAHHTGLSVPYLSDIERGNTNPTLETLTTLAAALEATVTDLLGDQPTAAAGRPLSISLQRFVRSDAPDCLPRWDSSTPRSTPPVIWNGFVPSGAPDRPRCCRSG